MQEYPYYHVSRRDGLSAIKPSRFDAFGRMPEPAVFVTTRPFITNWKLWIGEGRRDLYLYGINPPAGLPIEEGEDGAERGDFKIITCDPVPAEYIGLL